MIRRKGIPECTQPSDILIRFYFNLMTISMEKNSKISTDFFLRYCQAKNCETWIKERYNWPNPTKIICLRCYLALMNNIKIPIEYFLRYWWSRNLAIWLGKKDTTNQTQTKVVASYFTFTWWLTSCKKLRYCFVILRDIDNQRILLSDWKRRTSGYTQLK